MSLTVGTVDRAKDGGSGWLAALAACPLAFVQVAVVAELLAPLGNPAASAGFLPAILLASGLILCLGGWRSTLPVAALLPDPLLLASMVAALGAAMPDAPIGTLLLLTLGLSVVAFFAASVTTVHRLLDLVPLPLFAGLMGALGMVGVVAGMSLAGGAHVNEAFLTDPRHMLPGVLAVAAGLTMHGVARGPGKVMAKLAILALTGIIGAGVAQAPVHLGGAAGWPPMDIAAGWPGLEAAAALPGMATLALLAVLLARVAVRDMEIETGVDGEPVKEMALGGIASLLALGLAAVPVSFGSMGQGAVLSVGAAGQAARRVVFAIGGIFLAAAVVAALVRLPGLPSVITGAYLAFMGFGMIDTWIIRTARRAAMVERMTLFGVLATILILGPGYGLVIGNAAGAAAFALAYSRAKPVRARFTGRTVLSPVDRSPAENAVLKATGDARVVLTVRGFLFFGTADQLLGDVRDEIARGGLTHLVLDMGEVDGADGSAVVTFHRLIDEAHEAGVTLMLAQMGPDLAARLLPHGAEVLTYHSVSEALDMAERSVLEASDATIGLVQGFSDSLRVTHPEVAETILTAFEARQVSAGQVILAQGEHSEDLAFLEAGSASVYVALSSGGRVRVRRFGAGTMIGEMGFHLQVPRTASVVADEACRLLFLSRKSLKDLEERAPDAALTFHTLITQRLCRRILDKDHLVANLMTVSRR